MSRMRRPDVGEKPGPRTTIPTHGSSDSIQVSTGVWIGYDARDSLGTKEFGAKAALPVWMEYMAYALRSDKPKNLAASARDRVARASSPHFAPDRQRKQVSPVDVIQIPVSAGLAGYSMGWAPVPYGALSQYGMVRILSQGERRSDLRRMPRMKRETVVLQKIQPQFQPGRLRVQAIGLEFDPQSLCTASN